MFLGLAAADPPDVVFEPTPARAAYCVFVDRAGDGEINRVQDSALTCAIMASKNCKASWQVKARSLLEATESGDLDEFDLHDRVPSIATTAAAGTSSLS